MDAFKRLQRRNVTFGRPAKVSFVDSFIDPGDEVMAQHGISIYYNKRRGVVEAVVCPGFVAGRSAFSGDRG
ncbi:hypothetical protein Hdeb2414_s0007g00257941 [Helianthus debilis subsp. tardiflorus]